MPAADMSASVLSECGHSWGARQRKRRQNCREKACADRNLGSEGFHLPSLQRPTRHREGHASLSAAILIHLTLSDPAKFLAAIARNVACQLSRRSKPISFGLFHTVYSFVVIPFLHIGSLAIPTFGLMVASAMVCAYFLLRADIQRRGLAPDKASAAAMAEAFIAVPCLSGIIGAKLYHELQSPGEFFAHPLQLIFSQYGFAWFGGLIAGFSAYVGLARMRNIPVLEMLDAGSPAAALGYAVGRIGCLLSGDGDYGTPTSLPWGMSFPNGLVPTITKVHPTPIYEFFAASLIAWLLWRLGKMQIAARASGPGASQLRTGNVFAVYLILTGLERFLIEFIRINPRSFLGMSNAQTAGLLSTILGAILWLYFSQRPIVVPTAATTRRHVSKAIRK